jgi:hypothetical protein
MSIVAYGLNHRTASVELRERIAFPEENLSNMLSRLTSDLSNIREGSDRIDLQSNRIILLTEQRQYPRHKPVA